MPWEKTTVSATTASGVNAAANATTAVTFTMTTNVATATPALQVGAHLILSATVTVTVSPSNVTGGTAVGISAFPTNSNFNTGTATDFIGATFTNGGLTHTVTGGTSTSLTVTPAIATQINNGHSITLTRQAIYNVRAVSGTSVTIYPLTGVTVPAVAGSTALSFSNPILQSGTDTNADAGLTGLANIRADIINAFVDRPGAGTYAIGTTVVRVDNGSGAAPSILPVPFATFINGSGVHRITSYNSTTREITFSPGLTATLTDNAVLTITSQGVATNQGNGSTGVDVYTVYGTNVLVNGTLTWNAWSEQLVFSASCRADDTGTAIGAIVAPLMLAGATTINGTKSSGSVCPSPALILNTAGSGTSTFIQINSFTGSTTSINNASILANGWVVIGNGPNTVNNATFLFSSSGLDLLALAGTYTGFTNVGGRWNIPNGTSDYTLSNVVLDNAGVVTFGAITNNITVTVLDLVIRNATADWLQFRCTSPITRGKILFLNLGSGSFPSVAFAIDNNVIQGGMGYAGKSVNHSCKNLAGATLGDVKVFCADTLNGNAVNWFTAGVESAAYVRSQLSAVWDGASTRTYSWTTSASGSATSQNVVLAYYVNPNTRAINLSAFVSEPAFNGDAQIRVAAAASPTFGLFSAAPQVNGSFVNNGTRHLITTVTTNGTTDYTLSITPSLNAGIALSTRILITNVYYDIRNKTNIAAFVDNAAGYNAGATTILIDNGSGARTTIQPTVNSNFTYNGTYHNVTAVGTGTANKWQLTIQPGLSASLPDNTPITLRNIAGQDFYDFRTASYPHLPQGQELNLAGTGSLTNTWTLLDDATIDRPKAQVDLDTTLTTAKQVYDRAKSWWYDNFETLTVSQQGAVLVTRSGTTLNAGNYDLTLATSGSVFTFSGNTITINAPTFTDTLTTTGTITLNNPSTSQVNYASGIVPAGGTVALAVAGTYDLSGWTFASTGAARTIRNDSGGAVTVWLNPNQVANVTGSGANLSIVAKPQSLAAPNLADGTRAYAARVQTFTIASTAIDTSTDTITLGNDSQGKAAVFATAAPWTQVAFRLAPGATLPATTGNVLKDGGFYYWSGGKLYTSIANIPGTPVDFTSQGANNTATPPVLATLQAETELFNTTVSGGSGLSQSLTQPDGILIRFKATKWSESAGNASATQFLDTRDSLITWSAFTGATVSSTLELEAVHEQIVATSYVQSGKYGQLFPAKRGDQFGGKFGIALEGVGTLQINADDDSSNPAGVELLQDIFLWWCWVRSTEAGIRLASYDTLTAINFTTYQAGRVEVENTDATIPLIIAGGSISFAGSSNGIAATSNAIYLNVDVLGVVAITGVAAADIRSAVGLGSANLDSQLGDITALVL